MADALETIKTVLELIWTLMLALIDLLRSIYRTFVPKEPKSVIGEIILITGSGHGIGREMAIRFARLGAKVVCVDINAKGNEQTIQMIKKDMGKGFPYQCDVTDREAVFALADKVRKDVGEVTILVNNAGIMPCKLVTEQTQKEIELMMNLNVNANIWTIQAFLPSMIEKSHGHIVAMSSMAGLIGFRNLVPYCASKFAVKGLMEALASELHEIGVTGIYTTTVCPYIVNTGLVKNPRIRFPHMKILQPGEVADAIVDAVRREYFVITCPSYLWYLNKIGRALPFSTQTLFIDFANTGVDAHTD